MLFDSIRILDRVLVGYHMAGQAGKRQDILGPSALYIIAFTISTFIPHQVQVNTMDVFFTLNWVRSIKPTFLNTKA